MKSRVMGDRMRITETKLAKLAKLALVFGCLLGGLIVLSGCASPALGSGNTNDSADSAGSVFDPPRVLKDFTLTDQNGKPFHLSDLHGKAALVYFGYTHCPDYCPITLADFTRVRKALGDADPQTAFVFISVDGKNDTPPVLKTYLGAFDPSIIGLTGDIATVSQIGTDFAVYFTQTPDGQISHATRISLLDPDGKLRISYILGTPPDVMAQDVRKLLGK